MKNPAPGYAPGLQHQICNLLTLIEEAKHLGRVAVLPQVVIPPYHNHGYACYSYWEKYFSLDSLRSEVDWVSHEVALSMDLGAGRSVGLDATTLSLSQTEESLIERVFDDWNWFDVEFKLPSPLGPRDGTSLRWLNTCGWKHLKASPYVTRTADLVSGELGDYYALHVRRGDKAADPVTWPEITKGTSIPAIRERLSRWVPETSRLYILSDEQDPHYFDPLKEVYQVSMLSDFPELRDLIERGRDNFLAFMVETEIMRRAKLAMGTYRNKGLIPSEYALID